MTSTTRSSDRFQFGLRTLFWMVLLVSLPFAMWSWMGGIGLAIFLLGGAPGLLLAELIWSRSETKIGKGVAVAIVVVVAMVVLGTCITIRNTAIAAEQRHAMFVVPRLVEQYLIDHNGKWPRSWDELEATSSVQPTGLWVWPRDARRIKQLVEVDFGADSETLAQSDATKFDAVRPKGRAYYNYHSQLFELRHTLYVETGNCDRSIRELTELIEQYPPDHWYFVPQHYELRGRAYERKGDAEKAEADYAKANSR